MELNQVGIQDIIFLLLLPLVAFLYASVGHGGASGYLALMALFGFAPEEMKPLALILNVLVSFVAYMQYRKTAPMPIKLFIVLVLGSVPAAFWGGQIHIETHLYKIILGIFLMIPVVRLLGFFPLKETETKEHNPLLALLLGLSIGFFSGLIGIGGGIILSPILLLLGWSNLKTTASISALFITLNSISGLAGSSSYFEVLHVEMLIYIFLAFLGGILGAYYGSKRFSNKVLGKVLGIVLLLAVIKLIWVI